MQIIRADIHDTDLFSKEQLTFGACCFFSEDRTCKYFFKINGHEATLFANTPQHTAQAIEEFLYFSGFITTIKDEKGHVLAEKAPNAPFLHEILKIQPSQFYISEEKLARCKSWIKTPEDVLIPIIIKDDKTIALDGHTRLKAAIDLGFTHAYTYTEESGDYIFEFVNEAIRRGVQNVSDMEILKEQDYNTKWNKFCDEFLSGSDT